MERLHALISRITYVKNLNYISPLGFIMLLDRM